MVLALVLAVPGCVQQPGHKAEGTHARLKSWIAIVAVNGAPPEDPYLLMLPAGRYEVEALYRTYSKDYRCQFHFDAAGGQSYEIIEQSNPQPLVLYRWVRANSLWARRLDPVEPQCEIIP
jgi:hypothetical protein